MDNAYSLISSIKFGVFSSDEIKKYCVCEVNKIDKKTTEDKRNTLSDPRMGVFDPRLICETCKEGIIECQGHCGYIKLAKPVYHPLFIDEIKKILTIFCHDCRKFKKKVQNKIFRIKDAEKRFKKLFKHIKNAKKCQYSTKSECHRIFKIKTERNIIKKCMYDFSKNKYENVYNEYNIMDVKDFIENLDDDDLEIIGYDVKNTHPRNFIIEYLIVPPPSVRPAIFYSTNVKEDDLTIKYKKIVYSNENIKKLMSISTVAPNIQDHYNELNYNICTLFNNKRPDFIESKTRNNIPHKCYYTRMSGKYGRLRGNLGGRRVDYSSRAVITPDPFISIDEIGISYHFANRLTKKIAINRYNIKKFKKYTRDYIEGDEFPVIKNIIINTHGKEKIISIDDIDDEDFLKIGYVAERRLVDGDVVFLNRQPTLHRWSMAALKVSILKNSKIKCLTFRLNPALCKPFNADFDGDCMVIHIPQDYMVESELLNLALLSKGIISSQDNSPNVGLIQDGILGGYLLTKNDVYLEKEEFFECISYISDWDGKIPDPAISTPKPMWTGKQLLSLLIPKINVYKKKKINKVDNVAFSELYNHLCRKWFKNIKNGKVNYNSYVDFFINVFDFIDFVGLRKKQKEQDCWIFTKNEVINFINKYNFKYNGEVGEFFTEKDLFGFCFPNIEVSYDINKSRYYVETELFKTPENPRNPRKPGTPQKRQKPHLITNKTPINKKVCTIAEYIKSEYPSFYSFKLRELEFDTDDIYLKKNEVLKFLKNIINFNCTDIPDHLKKLTHLNKRKDFGLGENRESSPFGVSDELLECSFVNYDTKINDVELWSMRNIIGFITKCDSKIRQDGVGENKEDLIIKDGNIISGIFDKSVIGPTKNSLIHIIANECSYERATTFVNDFQRVVIHWLKNNSHTISLTDCILDKKTKVEIDIEKNLIMNKCYDEMNEDEINSYLNGANSKIGDIIKNNIKQNNIKDIIDCGSKGNILNIVQTIGCVGQINLYGNRIKSNDENRTLSYYDFNDKNPESKGFIRSSYLEGIPPQSNFFSYMAGVSGILDTSMKTSVVGYLQRKLSTFLEDVMVGYDHTVRCGENKIYEYVYGDDDIEGKGTQYIYIPFHKLNDKKFDDLYKWELKSNSLIKREYDQLIYDRRNLSSLMKMFPDGGIYHCINIERIISKSRELVGNTNEVGGSSAKLSIEYVITNVLKLIYWIKNYDYMPDDLSKIDDSYFPIDNISDGRNIDFKDDRRYKKTFLTRILIRFFLSSKYIIKTEKLKRESFDWVIHEILSTLINKRVNPGEMVGQLAAQSIGEPATQQTLNTFHYAGVSSKNITLGIPRLKELFRFSKDILSPSMDIFIKDGFDIDFNTILFDIKCTTFSDFVESDKIFKSPMGKGFTIHRKDTDHNDSYVEAIKTYLELKNPPYKYIGKWVLRYSLDKLSCLDIGVGDISGIIRGKFKKLIVIDSFEDSEELFIRIRSSNKKNDTKEYLNQMSKKIKKLHISGIKNIKNVYRERNTTNTGGSEFFYQTDGSNLKEVLKLDYVDIKRTTSNDVFEISKVFGIEAARNVLRREIEKVIKFDGAYINYRHINLLTNKMASSGKITSLDRNGFKNSETGVLKKAMFEVHLQVFRDAARYSKIDNLSDITSQICNGLLPKLGTGITDVLVNLEMLKDIEDNDPEIELTPETPKHPKNWISTPYHTMINSPYPKNKLNDGYAKTPYNELYSYSSFSPFRPNIPYSPKNQQYSPTSKQFQETSPSSHMYSPTSPEYNTSYTQYSPTSPQFAPSSPQYSPTSPQFAPSSPQYSPTSPQFAPSSPQYSPTSPQNAPSSPQYSPTSPQNAPSSPDYNPSSPQYSPTSPQHAPSSPEYNPSSPEYNMFKKFNFKIPEIDIQ